MAAVLEIRDYWVTNHNGVITCHFQALVDDAVQVCAAGPYSPPEFGEAVCFGDVDLADDELPPSPDDEQDLLCLADTVQNWELPEPSDEEMMSSFGTKWHDGL